jgi:5'-nucleotidase
MDTPLILLTNDDGVDAPGLAALHEATAGRGRRVVVAPDGPRSGTGHAVTTAEPIAIAAVRPDWFALSGTPADCARLGLLHLASGADWVLAGINRGGNLGVDVYISGTVAAAREAAILGFRAIALSQYVRSDLELDWSWTLAQARRAIDALLERPPRPGWFWNVNLPHLPPAAAPPDLIFCGLDFRPLQVRFRLEATREGDRQAATYAGDYHARGRDPGRDVAVCFGGAIAVTEVPIDIAR